LVRSFPKSATGHFPPGVVDHGGVVSGVADVVGAEDDLSTGIRVTAVSDLGDG
jgi:hypothetical protein